LIDERDSQESMPEDPRLSALYRRTRIETSPADLDKTIRGAARRVAQRRRYRWILPLSSAAVVLLGLSLTLKLGELARPPEEAILSEKEEADVKSESTFTLDGAEPETLAPMSPSPLVKKLPPLDDDTAIHMRKRSTTPTQEYARGERHGLIQDQAATIGAAAPSRAQAAPQEASASEFGSAIGLDSDPTSWLRHIRDLVAQGRTDDAAAQLAEFRTGYPNHPLPDDLTELLNP
jgi:hypothetical protein